MKMRRMAGRFVAFVTIFALVALTAVTARAQNYGGGGYGNSGGGSYGNNRSGGGYGNNSGGGYGNNSGGYGGSGYSSLSGVALADGILFKAKEDAGLLDQARLEAAYQGIPSEMRKASPLRKVSLTRLEKAIQENGGVVADEMENLAGLERIENVFFYPETGDVVIAGPAEGWVPGIEASTVGMTSRRPTLKLSDLVVALRAYPADAQPTQLIGCSIDPTADGLDAMQGFLKEAKKPNVGNDIELEEYAEGLRQSLGLQDVKVWGISPKTNFAVTLIAADYRMKLIGIGLEKKPVAMATYVEKSNPQMMAKNALVRWYFQPDYDCVIQTEDGMALGLTGDGVKLVGEDELVGSGGKRVAEKGRANKASRVYTKSFTDQFSKIAGQVPVYASLRNLIDMSVVAAWLQKENIYQKANWSMDFFGDEERFSVETAPAVERAVPAVNIVAHGKGIVSFPIGGGVMIEPTTALDEKHVTADKGDVAETRKKVGGAMPENVWWWD